MTILVPSRELVARFRRDVEALAPGFGRLGAAVSGGPDSLALLLLAHEAFPGRVEAATVDHRLRPESTIEALHVEDVCARLGCPHVILDVEVPAGPAGLQGEARAARYGALTGWARARGLSHLATAHHADDQAETLLMRLQRGSGVGGLAGIRPVRAEGGITLIRPLLGWSKAELVRLVGDTGIEAVEDPSNSDMRFDRAAMRVFLRDHPEFEPRRIARTAAAAREAEEALDWAADRLADERIVAEGGEWRLYPAGLPREMRRRLLTRAIAQVRAEAGLGWSGDEDVEGLLAALETGGAATRGGVMAKGGAAWRLRLAPPRRGTR